MKQIQAKKAWTAPYEKVETSLQDLEVLFDFYSMDEVSEEEMKSEYKKVLGEVEDLELKKMLSSEEDQLNAVLEINPGAGGTESNDWASILMRMYIMWGEKNGYKVREVDLQEGEVAGRGRCDGDSRRRRRKRRKKVTAMETPVKLYWI